MKRALPSILALVLGIPSSAAAQARDVLVRIDPHDPVSEATSLELAQRGLSPTYDVAPRPADAPGRANESRVAALALGACAAVWIDAAPDGRSLVVRALRAADGEEGASFVSADDVRMEPRLVGIVAGTLAEEILARPLAPAPEPAVAPTSLDDTTSETAPHSAAAAPGLRAYGTFSAEVWARFDPAFGGGMTLRGSSGAEWPDGLRVGALVRLFSGSAVTAADQSVRQLASGALVGAEVVGRLQVPGHALIVGASVAMGAAHRREPTGSERWDLAIAAGSLVGFAFPVGPFGAEMGVHVALDAVIDPSRGVAVSPSLGLRWDFR